MTHKEQFVAMLDEAGIQYGYSQGDSVIAGSCRLRFYLDGRLKKVECEGGEEMEYDDY